jgi:hypothetical protein
MFSHQVAKCFAAHLLCAASLSFVEVHRAGQGNIPSWALDELQDVALSPDGINLYTLSGNSDSGSGSGALTAFKRVEVGSLRFMAAASHHNVEWLLGARALTVSMDGRHIYVVAVGRPCIAAFKRDQAYPSVLRTVSVVQSSVSVPLRAPSNVAVSPTDVFSQHVYVTDRTNNALLIFTRDYQSGALTIKQIFQSSAGPQAGGEKIASAIKVGQLGQPDAIGISKDGKGLYVSSSEPNGIAVFKCVPRGMHGSSNPEAGLCKYSTFVSGAGGESVRHLAVHPSGLAMFAVDEGPKSMNVFKIGYQDALSKVSSFHNGNDCVRMSGYFVAAGADTVVVAGVGDHAVALFRWDSSAPVSSALSFQSSVKNGDRLSPSAPPVDGLGDVRAAAWSPDMANLYTISRQDKALAVFTWKGNSVTDPCVSDKQHIKNSEQGNAGLETGSASKSTSGLETGPASNSKDHEDNTSKSKDHQDNTGVIVAVVLSVSCVIFSISCISFSMVRSRSKDRQRLSGAAAQTVGISQA